MAYKAFCDLPFFLTLFSAALSLHLPAVWTAFRSFDILYFSPLACPLGVLSAWNDLPSSYLLTDPCCILNISSTRPSLTSYTELKHFMYSPIPFLKKIFMYVCMYLFMAVSGLSCGTWDLRCSAQVLRSSARAPLYLLCTGSLVVACGLSSCSLQAL